MRKLKNKNIKVCEYLYKLFNYKHYSSLVFLTDMTPPPKLNYNSQMEKKKKKCYVLAN